MFYPILKGIQSSGQSEEFDLNQIHEVVLKEDGLTYLSANILRNHLRGLSEVQTGPGRRHIFSHCVIKDFSPTGAARTFALDLQTLIRNELEDEIYYLICVNNDSLLNMTCAFYDHTLSLPHCNFLLSGDHSSIPEFPFY